ncbi:putative Proactivator polypeptide [Paratrimastix pyriformis]|uniref:Proactivator polypeptide n=1 Tax=Paratrimastix pyriformis TaxID=342808 RepID=A0ABQ8UK23_9EUKA|nr:putative Proactivator polypeptide [Paratrimastix pyriformis]
MSRLAARPANGYWVIHQGGTIIEMRSLFLLALLLPAIFAAAVPAPQNGKVECSVCEFVVQELDKWIEENATETEIEQIVGKICMYVPKALQPICKSFIDEYTPQLIDLFVKDVPADKICKTMRLCGTSKPAPVHTPSLECTVCQFIMSELESFLTQAKTEEEIVKAVEQVCSRLPGFIQGPCHDLIEQYGPEIIQLLVDKENPQTICTQIKLCNKSVPQVEITAECAVCRWILVTLESWISSNTTEAEIEKMVENVCTHLPKGISAQCDALVEEYGALIIDMLIQEADPNIICHKLGLCTENVLPPTPVVPAPAENTIQCAVCEWVLTELDTLIQENATEAEIEKIVEKVCTRLPASVRSMCDAFVEEYAPVVIELLVKETDPAKICTLIGLCGKSQKVAASKFECTLCEWVMTELEKLVSENSTESEIEHALDAVCTKLPKTVSGMCEQLVDQYTPLVIDLLLKKIPIEAVCTHLGLCAPAVEEAPVNSIQCAVCEWVMTELEYLVEKNSTEAEIEKALDAVCDRLPSSVHSMCDAFVEEYTPVLIELLVKKVDPAKVCQIIGLCGKSAAAVDVDVECPLCHFVVGKLDEMLGSERSKETVEAALDKVCARVPAPAQGLCKSLVRQYAPVLIDALVQKLEPAAICALIKVCPKTTAVNSIQCAVCEWVVTELDQLVQTNRSEAAIEAALDKVCALLPKTLTTVCDDFVATYGPALISLLAQEMKPEQVCSFIKLCGAQQAMPQTPAPAVLRRL